MTTGVTTLTTAPRWRGTDFATQVAVLTGRSLRSLVGDPRMIFLSLLQPLVMLTLFSQIFASMANTPGFPSGVRYIDYLMPAILVNTAMQSALQAGIGLITDMKNGVLARFRSLPIRLGSVLVARSLSDLVRTTAQLVLMLLFAVTIFGFAPAGGVLGTLAALALALVVGWGLGWIFLAIAAWLRNAEMMQTVGFLAMFPLMFASSAYVPVAGLPAWLRAVAEVNPLTYAVNAARSLALAQPVTGVVGALVASAALAAVGGALAIRGFRRPLS
ncbi:ABC transporter permease [Actinosynnema sp. NPDC020468]|uniref:ABC transporter permease n=1 Tax=Actinosynnema sp. NPDC020468 TaxID=3154488 RepID=UPI00340513A4